MRIQELIDRLYEAAGTLGVDAEVVADTGAVTASDGEITGLVLETDRPSGPVVWIS